MMYTYSGNADHDIYSMCLGMSICWGLSQVLSYIIRDLHTHRRAALLTFFSITYKWLLIGVKALIITLLSLSLPPLLIGQEPRRVYV